MMIDPKGSLEGGLCPLWVKNALERGRRPWPPLLHCDFANQNWTAAGKLGLQFCLCRNIDDWMLEGLAA